MVTWWWGLDEAQRGESAEERLVELDLGGLVPPLELGVLLEVATLGADRGRLAIPPCRLVSPGEQEQIMVWHLLLPGQGQPL